MKRTVAFLGSMLLLAGCRPAGGVLGVEPAGSAVTLVQAAATTNGPVTVEGELVEKCPVAGCWFVLKDATGTLRVDTKSAGFVVVEVPLHRQVRVIGTMIRTASGAELAATGLRH